MNAAHTEITVAQPIRPSFPLTVLYGLFGIVLALILWHNNGRFVYTGDDPYIHLALAENIARGHYGINLDEYSAPSSSIIWPYLLAPFATLSFGDLVPLLINTLATTITVWLTSKIFGFLGEGAQSPRWPFSVTVVVSLLILVLVGPAFSGMEHSLQVLLSTTVLFGLVRSLMQERVNWWFVLAVVAGPLVRYENLAFAVPAVLYLFYRRKYLVALLCMIGIAVPLLSFSLYLNSLGLGYFATSILVKSDIVRSRGSITAIFANAWSNIFTLGGPLLYVTLGFVTKAALSSRRHFNDRLLATFISCAVLLHVCGGKFGRYGYEVYVSYPALIAAVYLYRNSWREIVGSRKTLVGSAVIATLLTIQYLASPLVVPLAASNVFEQQYQMHRFVTDYYRVPVAVNDLGWVSYRNDEYVLDLWGLGSTEVFRRRTIERPSHWTESLARDHGVKLVMVYPSLWRDLPESWVKVGELQLGNVRIGAPYRTVGFFVTDDAALHAVIPLLEEFRRTLPGKVRFSFGGSVGSRVPTIPEARASPVASGRHRPSSLCSCSSRLRKVPEVLYHPFEICVHVHAVGSCHEEKTSPG